jgi:hypothetical protein
MAEQSTYALMNPTETASCERVFELAEPRDASSVVTGLALYWMQRLARQTGWDLWHAQPCRDRQPLRVTETALIRGRKVSLNLFISVHGATYCRRWSVDGYAWKFSEVKQAFDL